MITKIPPHYINGTEYLVSLLLFVPLWAGTFYTAVELPATSRSIDFRSKDGDRDNLTDHWNFKRNKDYWMSYLAYFKDRISVGIFPFKFRCAMFLLRLCKGKITSKWTNVSGLYYIKKKVVYCLQVLPIDLSGIRFSSIREKEALLMISHLNSSFWALNPWMHIRYHPIKHR